MFERPQGGERAVLVYVGLGQKITEEDEQEFESLALSAGAEVVGRLSSQRQEPSPRYLVGSGKLDELKELVAATDADLILFDHDLSPRQQKNVEDVKASGKATIPSASRTPVTTNNSSSAIPKFLYPNSVWI